MDIRAKRQRKLADDLRDAVALRGLDINFQPLVEPRTLRVRACEALARWSHADLGQIGPSEFIPIAEANGLIVDIGKWVLAEACREAIRWPESIRVAVNISPVHFNDESFLAAVADALARSGLDASRLEIEITEMTLLHVSNRTRSNLSGLKRMGVRLALDDFGSGYAGLNYLHQFRLDKIKVDNRYVRHALEGENGFALLAGIIRLIKDLRMEVAIEGVETEDQLEVLSKLDVDELQGFLFGLPLPTEQMFTLLQQSRPNASPTVIRRGSLRLVVDGGEGI
jgi:EAL domain-containing protein (putative c-di-GMP-specific phosphodiesterase class I)